MIQTCIRWGTLAAALVVMAACSGDSTISGPGPASYTLVPIGSDETQTILAGAVKVCRLDGDATIATSEFPLDPLSTIKSTSELPDFGCSVTWLRNTAEGSFDVTVSQTGPDDFRIWGLVVQHNTDNTQNFSVTTDCSGAGILPASRTVTLATAEAGALIYFKQCTPLPPPPADCHGLTPGFWKNWANRYTTTQFDLIIAGTPFAGESRQSVTNVLNGNNPAIVKLKKFVYANELTKSLTSLGNTMPNPSGGSMTGACSIGNDDLADALALAHLMLLNPGNYDRGAIGDLADLLDDFANMDD